MYTSIKQADSNMDESTHIGDIFFGGCIGVGQLPELETPGIEHDLIGIKHVLRRLLELQYDTRVSTGVVDEALGCLGETVLVGNLQPAIREDPLDLRAHVWECTHASRRLPHWIV